MDTNQKRRRSAMAVWQEIEEPEILFIGDNYDVAEMYRIKLELDGYRVRVTDRAAAIDQARRRPPDLLYVDLTERGSHDLQLLARVRKESRRPDPEAGCSKQEEGQQEPGSDDHPADHACERLAGRADGARQAAGL